MPLGGHALEQGDLHMFSRSSGNLRGRATAPSPVPLARIASDQGECDVVVTRDHEYFVLSGVCVAVRERSSGRFVRQDLSSGVASLHRGSIAPHANGSGRTSPSKVGETVRNMPRIGEWLCLERGGTVHYVGPVLGCERRRLPSRRIVEPVLRKARLD